MTKHKAFIGTNGAWGVTLDGSVLYEPSFTEKTAKEIARIGNLDELPDDWDATERMLKRRKLDLSDPSLERLNAKAKP